MKNFREMECQSCIAFVRIKNLQVKENEFLSQYCDDFL